MPTPNTILRPRPKLPDLSTLPTRTFELQRGGFGGEMEEHHVLTRNGKPATSGPSPGTTWLTATTWRNWTTP